MNIQPLFSAVRRVIRRARQAPRSAAEPMPPMRATRQEIFQRLAIYLCVAVSCISVLFASCAKAPAEDAPADAAVTDTVR
jgi:cytochrome b561